MAASDRLVNIILSVIDRSTGALRAIDRSVRTVERSFEQLDDQLQEANTSMAEVGVAVAALNAAMLAPFILGVKKAAEFEQAMAGVKAISGATTKEFAGLTKVALDLGRTTSFTAVEAADGLKFLALAGLDAATSIKALPSVLQLAQAGALDLGTAADITTNILTAYRFEAEDLVRVNDVLVKAFTNSNTNLVELGEGFKFVGPVARGLGSEFEDIIATMGKLADAGIKASVAGTTLRGTLAALFNPTREESKLLDQISTRIGGVGLQIKNSEGNFVGFGDIIEQLEKAGVGADEALRLFGLRAGPGIAALLGIGSKNIKDFTVELKVLDGAAKKIAEIMDATLIGAIKRLNSAIDGLKISIGTPFLNALASMSDNLSVMIIAVTDLHDALGPLATVIDGTVAVLGGILVVLAGAAASFNFIIKPILAFIRVLGGAGALTGIAGAASAAWTSIVALGVALGPAGLAFLAALNVLKIIELVSILVDLRRETKSLAEAKEGLERGDKKLAEALSKISKELGINIKDMDAFNRLVKDGEIVYDNAAKKWIKSANNTKDAFDRNSAAVKKMIDDALDAIEGFSAASTTISIETQQRINELRQLVVAGVKSEKEAVAVRENILILEAQRRVDLANDVLGKVKIAYGSETAEFEKANTERLNAENDLADARLSVSERLFDEKKKLEIAEQKGILAASLLKTEEEFEKLGQLFKQGELTIQDFFETRRSLVNAQYETETEAIKELIEQEDDEIKKIGLRTELAQKEIEYQKTKIDLDAKELESVDKLMEAREKMQSIPEEAEKRVSVGGIDDTTLAGKQQIELDALETKQEKELAMLSEMTVAKELEGQKQLDIARLLTAQEIELEQLKTSQKKAEVQSRIDSEVTAAGVIGGIFSDLNTVFGKETKAFFLLEKAAAIMSVIMNTEVAASKAGAQLGIFGIGMSTLIRAKGLASVALISAQAIQGLAFGGQVKGSSPGPRADNIRINATAGEYMHPVDAVKHYGLGVMEAIRSKSIPREIFHGIKMPSGITSPGTNFNTGGFVAAGNTSSFSLSVPVSISGASNPEALASKIQVGIEDTVRMIMRQEMGS